MRESTLSGNNGMMTKAGVIIVAGGTGSRMGNAVPKQFLPIGGREILARTIEKFVRALPGCRIVVVLPENDMERWEEIVKRNDMDNTHTVCAGGSTRFISVRNGLDALDGCDVIAVHDGVRPFVSERLINHCMDTALKYGTAIPAVKPVDSFRIIVDDKALVTDRDRLRAIQTPQVFKAELLKSAYTTVYSPLFTDDASVVENTGAELTFCEGEYRNIKITSPDDLLIARALAEAEDKEYEK